MSGFFSSENKFFVLMNKIFDMLVLSLIWLVMSISGLTLIGYLIGTGKVTVGSGAFFAIAAVAILLTSLTGPASTAFYYTVVKVVRRERSYLFKEFIRSFKLNFKQGIVIAFVYEVLAGIMVFDFLYVSEASKNGSKASSIMLGAFFVLAVFTVFSVIYAFPVLSRFTVTNLNLIKWAFFLSIRHIGWTLLLGVLFIGSAVIMYYAFLWMPPLLIIMPAIYTFVVSLPMERVFKRYMPLEEESEEESGIDRWYNE